MSDFSSLNVALSGLYAQRRGLEVTGNNISNVNTQGYSRQRVDMQSVGGPTTGTFWSGGLDAGGGVNVTGITRFRDSFLEIRAALEHGDSGNLSRANTSLAQIESLFNEPSDLSIAKSMSDFMSGWDDVANHPGDPAARQQLLERATTLAKTINTAANGLAQMRTDSIGELDSLTSEVNTMAANIAKLNGAIRSATTAGLSPNDLLDQRDALVTQLADKIGVTVRPGADGQVNVLLGGTSLVNGDSSLALKVDTTGPNPSIAWVGSNHVATVTGGEIGGLLGIVNATIPTFSASLDAVALKLRDDVNALHVTGSGLDGVSGRKFFDATSATDFAVSANIGTNINNIAAAASGAGVLDGSIALKIGDLATASNGAQALYHQMVVSLGVESQSSQRRLDIQSKAADQIDNARESVSGVNTDEEMVSMVQYQHAYEASARFMTTIDQMLDTLVNRTGLVGR